MATTLSAREINIHLIDLLYQERTDLVRRLVEEVKTYIAVSQEERKKEISHLGQKLARSQSLRYKDFEAIIQDLQERSSARASQMLAALEGFSQTENDIAERLIPLVHEGKMQETNTREWRGQVNKARSELVSILSSFVAEQEEIKAALQRLAAAEGLTVVVHLLEAGEEIKAGDEMWYWEPSPKAAATWRRGFLYLTTQRVFWWSDFDTRINWAIPLKQLQRVELGERDLGGMLGKKRILMLQYGGAGQEQVAFFSGPEAAEAGWLEALGEIVGSEQEACPQCGCLAPAEILLETGCSQCGWISARAKRGRRKEHDSQPSS